MAEWKVNADREMLEQSFILSLLIPGCTILENVRETQASLQLLEVLKEFGLTVQREDDKILLSGTGLRYKIPSIFPSSLSQNAEALLWALASRDTFDSHTIFLDSPSDVSKKIDFLKKITDAKIESQDEGKIVFRFPEERSSLKKMSFGGYSYLARNYAILSSLIAGVPLEIEEKISVRDQWSGMLAYFGCDISLVFHSPSAFQNEFERRLAKARGERLERFWKTSFSGQCSFSQKAYRVPGDITEACALAAVILLSRRGDSEEILQVLATSSRASAISLLKRMGGDLEFVSKRERFGAQFANLRVKPLASGKRLQGMHFSGDLLASATEELPILAVVSCFAEKETIFHLPHEFMESEREMLELLAKNLRLSGAEIGLYEDGLVVRGKEEPEVDQFDCGNYPVLGLALSIFTSLAKGGKKIKGIEHAERVFPNACEKMRILSGKGALDAF